MPFGCIGLVLLALALGGCDKSQPSGDPATTQATLTTASAKSSPLPASGKSGTPAMGAEVTPDAKHMASAIPQRVFATADLPSDVEVRGSVMGGLRWTDNNGDNFIVFSNETLKGDDSDCEAVPCDPKTLLLRANHVAAASSGTKVLRRMKAREADCEFDLVSTIVEQSLGVTDLDEDGIGEASFAFRISCASDMGPLVLKLLLFEGGDKYIIRGHTRYADQDLGDDKEVDALLLNADPRFLGHATALWDRIVKLDPYE